MALSARPALASLTALRFVAALFVFSWHCVPTRKVSATFSLGYAGVAFFFVLSGFILTYTYRDVFSARAFYVARLARVYPLHLAVMPFAILVLATCGPNPVWSAVDVATRVREIAAQLVLVQSWSTNPVVHFGANGPAWSISDEAFFYLLFPALAWGLARLTRGLGPGRLTAALGGGWLTVVAILWPLPAVHNEWAIYVAPPVRLLDFMGGMVLALIFLRGAGTARAPLRATSLEMLAVTFAALAIAVSVVLPPALRFSAGLFPASAFAIVVFARGGGALARLLAHPVAVRLGEASFAFYLVHLPVIEATQAVLGWASPLALPLAFGGSLGLALALHRFLEEPLRERIRRRLASAPRPSSAGTRARDDRPPAHATPAPS